MSTPKLVKFTELNTFANVFQNHKYKEPQLIDHRGEKVELKGSWADRVFKNRHPITLELACGRGEYSLGMAAIYPQRNFIGVDLKGNRIYTGAKSALNEGLGNVAFLRTEISQLHLFFNKNEIDEIWIVFPDPHLKKSKYGKRLTSERYINLYRQIAAAGTTVHLKTDNPELYDFTLESVRDTGCELKFSSENIYLGDLPLPELAIKTYYEQMHLEAGRTIKYVRFGI